MKNGSGVSPVVGVLLMVSIVVILAAVVASVVFGMAGDYREHYTIRVIDRYNESASSYYVLTSDGDVYESSYGILDGGMLVNHTYNITVMDGNHVTSHREVRERPGWLK